MVFSVNENVLMVEAGHLKRPWLPNVKNYDGVPFFKILTTCIGFSGAMGVTDRDRLRGQPPSSMSRWRLANNTFMKYMTRLRDNAVDKMIIEYLRSEDPSADADVGEVLDKSANRSALYHQASIPHIVPVIYPGYVADDGNRVVDFEFKCFSTPSRKRIVTVALSVDSLNAMYVACNNSEHRRQMMFDDGWDDNVEEEAYEDGYDLPFAITKPNVKWCRRLRNGMVEWSLYTTHRDSSGRLKTNTHTVRGMVREQFERVEAHLQSLYDTNNVCKPNDGPFASFSAGELAGG